MKNRTNLIRIRVSDEEKKEIEKQAKNCGLNTSSYVRMLLFYFNKNKKIE